MVRKRQEMVRKRQEVGAAQHPSPLIGSLSYSCPHTPSGGEAPSRSGSWAAFRAIELREPGLAKQ